jgi:hypothetical protein
MLHVLLPPIWLYFKSANLRISPPFSCHIAVFWWLAWLKAFYVYFRSGWCGIHMIMIKDDMTNPPEVERVRLFIRGSYLIYAVMIACCVALTVQFNMPSNVRYYLWATFGTSVAVLLAYGAIYLVIGSINMLITCIDKLTKFNAKMISSSPGGASLDSNKVSLSRLHTRRVLVIIQIAVVYILAPSAMVAFLLFWIPASITWRPYIVNLIMTVAFAAYIPLAYLIMLQQKVEK